MGQRAGVTGRPGRGDTFVQEEHVDRVIPDNGPVSVTARVHGVNFGEWSVVAELVTAPAKVGKGVRLRSSELRGRKLPAAGWSWRRWKIEPAPPRLLNTRWTRIVGFDPIPAVIPGSWAGLVALGVIVGVVSQALLLAHQHLSVGTVLPLSLLAVAAGIAGGKLWFIALNLRTWRAAPEDGFCIQGALVGATAIGGAAVALFHLPLGLILDTTAPGLFVGVAIGRMGCFFTGCCAGRLSTSRFAIWSSDRRVGARRIPTQPLESFAALCIGLVGLFLVLTVRLTIPGAIFVASMAAYTLCRQFILRLRFEQRRSAIGGPLTAVLAALVFGGSVAWLLVGVR